MSLSDSTKNRILTGSESFLKTIYGYPRTNDAKARIILNGGETVCKPNTTLYDLPPEESLGLGLCVEKLNHPHQLTPN
jgi:hypothetical protein